MVQSLYKRKLLDHYTNERKKALDFVRPLKVPALIKIKFLESWEYYYMEITGDFTEQFYTKLFDEITKEQILCNKDKNNLDS